MFKCLGGGLRQENLEDEVAWLKRMLEKETLQRRVAQAQLHQEQTKCAILEQEIQQAAAAAHEMGESLRQFFSRNAGSECSDPAFHWAPASISCPSEPCLAGDTPRSTDQQQHQKHTHREMPTHHDTSSMHDQIGRGPLSAPAQPHSKSRLRLTHQQQQQLSSARVQHRQHDPPRPSHSSCSSTRESQLRCSSQQSNSTISEFSPLLNRQPSLSHKSSAKMKRHVLQVADQLKGLAMSWQQRLEEYQPLHGGPAAVSVGAIVPSADVGRSKAEHALSPRTTATPAASHPAASGGGTGTSGLSKGPAGLAAAAPAADRTGHSGMHASWAQKQQQLQYKQPQEVQASTESLQVPAASGSSQFDPPYPTTSVEWGSSSGFTGNHSGSTPIGVYDAGDVSSSTGSFVRYRSSLQHCGVADIAEGEEECEHSENEKPQQLQDDAGEQTDEGQISEEGSEDEQLSDAEGDKHETESGHGSCLTDEEAEAQMLQWHLQQMEKEEQQQHQASQHRLLSQKVQQQAPAAVSLQQQGTGSFSAWSQPSRDASAPRCAITRGAASRGTPPSSAGVHFPGYLGAAHLTPPAAGPSPLAAGVAALRSVTQSRTTPQQQQTQCSLLAQQHTCLQGTSSWQQQLQKRQQQLSLRQREAASADAVPQGLKSMAPLRRHQQYWGAT